MTQEEKAEAYDKIRDRAKKELGACGSQDCDAARQIFRLFPELKESEDEKIRNQIIEHIKWSYGEQECAEEEMHRWISWLERQGEQNPAWSEEDEKIINGITSYLCTHDSCELDGFDKWYDFLKSLKNRVLPKQEWSEEDGSRMDNLCHFLEEYGNQYYGHLTLQGTISWLKSLKPQNWKPSDEQMENLSRAFNGGTYRASLLMELYQDLKKLK